MPLRLGMCLTSAMYVLPRCWLSQFYNAQTRAHLINIAGHQAPLSLNLTDGSVRWEKADKKPPQPKKPQDQAKTPAAAAAAAGQHAPHAAKTPAAAAQPKENPYVVSREPPAPEFRSPQPGVSLTGKRIRVWWPEDKAWYAGEVTVSVALMVWQALCSNAQPAHSSWLAAVSAAGWSKEFILC